jgi:mannose-6-phosphate isomerase-like protein (cupin superfamily)
MKNNINLLNSVLLVSLFFLSMTAQTKTENAGNSDTTKYTLENCINKFSIDKIEKTKVGYQYWFADPNLADGKTLKMSVVAPHSATHPPHVHAEDEFFFILEGNAELYLQGKWTPAEPYTSFYCPSNVEHGIRNTGDTELKYLVIKQYDTMNPVRMEFTKKQGSGKQ